MTISNNSVLTSYAGNGSTTLFATGFVFFQSDELIVVTETVATGALTVLAEGSDYTVSGGEGPSGIPSTGSVTTTAAYAAGTTVHILRATAFLQQTDLVDNTELRAVVVEAALDRLTALAQELRHAMQRTIRLPTVGAAVDDLGLPYPRRDTVIGFDENGELALLPSDGLGAGGSSAVWGSVTGTLSAQTDLQNALDAKAPASDLAAHIANGTNPHDTSFENLDDSVIATPSTGQAIMFNGSAWANRGLVEADVSDLGAYLEEVAPADLDATNTPANGQVPTYDSVTGQFEWAGSAASAVWGGITGTLADQTDLQTALNLKLEEVDLADLNTSNSASDGDFLTVSGGVILWGAGPEDSLWDTADPNAPAAIDQPRAVTFSPDGSLAVFGTDDGVKVYSTADWTIVPGAPTAGVQATTSAAFSPDGALLALGFSQSGGSAATRLRVFQTSDWEEVHTASSVTVTDVHFDRNSAYLAAAISDAPGAIVLKVSDWTSESLGFFSVDAGYACRFSPTADRLALGTDSTPYVTVFDTGWNIVVGPAGGNIPTDTVASLAYSPDGTRLAVGWATYADFPDVDSIVRVYNTSTWATVETLPTVVDSQPSTLDYSPDGEYLARAEQIRLGTHQGLFLYDVSDDYSLLPGTFDFGSDKVYAAAFNSASTLLGVAAGEFISAYADTYVVRRTPSANVISVNGQTGVVDLTTSNIPEGVDLYHTDARAVTAIKADADWNASNWDIAFGWGNHASAGYLTEVGPTDLDTTNSPTNGQTLTYNSATANFTWVAASLTDVAPTDLDATNAPLNNWVPTFDSGTGRFTWEPRLAEVGPTDLITTNSPADDQLLSFDQATGGFTWVTSAAAAIEPDDLEATNTPSNGWVPTFNSVTGTFTWSAAAAGGASDFTDLDDTPSSYGASATQLVAVNGAGAGLAFTNDVSVQEVTPQLTGAVARQLQARAVDIVSVFDFGAVGDGTTDDAAAIQAAIDSGANRILLGRRHKINSTLNVRRGGFDLIGTGVHGGVTFQGKSDEATTLFWGGASGGTMLYVGPAAVPNNGLITGLSIIGVNLDGEGIAARGFVLESCRWCRFYLGAANCTEYQIITGCAPQTNGDNRDFQMNECTFFARAVGSANGVFLTARGHEPGADSGQQGNTSLNIFHYIDVRCDDGIGVTLGSSDNNHIRILRVFCFGNPSAQIVFRGARTVGAHPEESARTDWIGGCSVRSDRNGIKIEGTDTSGVTGGATNVIIGLDKDNSTPDPIIGTGASARITRSNGTMSGWSFSQLALGSSTAQAESARTALDSRSECLRLQSESGLWWSAADSAGATVAEFRSDGANRVRFNFPTINGSERLRVNAPVNVVSLTETSDAILKTDIAALGCVDCYDAITKLQPRRFRWKQNKRADTGLVAQEVEKVLPGLVSGEGTEDDPKGVQYSKLTVYLLGAFQHLAKKVKDLEERNHQLETGLNRLIAPATVAKKGAKFRVVEASGRLSRWADGSRADNGGFDTEAGAQKAADKVNALRKTKWES